MESGGPQCLEVNLIPVESIPALDECGRYPGGEPAAATAASGGLSEEKQAIPRPPSSTSSHHQAIRTAVANLQIQSTHSSQTEQPHPHHTPLYTTAPLPNRSRFVSQHPSRPVPSTHSGQSAPPVQFVSFAPPVVPPGQHSLPTAHSEIAGFERRGPLVSLIWQANVVGVDAFQTAAIAGNAGNVYTTAPLATHRLPGHGIPQFPPLSPHHPGTVSGVATVGTGPGAIGGAISELNAGCAATGEPGQGGHGISSEIAHISCAPHTHEIGSAQTPSVPTPATQPDNLSSLPDFIVTNRLPAEGKGELGGGGGGGNPVRSSTQTSGAGHSKAADSRPPSVIPTICSNHPNPPINTSHPNPISLSLPQPNRPQRHQHTATNDVGASDHGLSIPPPPQSTTSGAECNTLLVNRFTVPADKLNGASSAHASTSAPPQIVFMYSDPRAQSAQTESETSYSSAQVAASRIQAIANVMTNTTVTGMNLSIDTTARATPSPSLNSPVLETPNTASLPEPAMADDGRIPKTEISVDGSHPSDSQYGSTYGAGGQGGQQNSLIFQLPRPQPHPAQSQPSASASATLQRARTSHQQQQQYPPLASSGMLSSSSAPYNAPSAPTQPPSSIYTSANYYVSQAHFQPRTTPPAESTPSFPTNSFNQFAPSTPASQQRHQLSTPSSTTYPFTPDSSESSRHGYYYASYSYQTPSGPAGPPSGQDFSAPYHSQASDPYTPTAALVHRGSYGPPGYVPRWYQPSGSTTPTGPPYPYYSQMVQRPSEPILAPGEEPAQRPTACYAALIAEALLFSPAPHQLLVAEIAESIKARHPYYRQYPSKIYNGVRHQTSMCKAFVKLNRPWGDQSGGARKWAIRDGCQNSFQLGSPTWTLPQRFTSSGALKARAKTQAQGRMASKPKQLALGHGGETPDRELSPFDESNGPSTGAPWDPSKDPHPWRNEPAYQAHLARQAEIDAQKQDAEDENEPHTPRSQPQQVLPYYSSSNGSGYSLSPHSPFNYNHHAYMQQGLYHPAYSPTGGYVQHNDYGEHEYFPAAPGTADPARLNGPVSTFGALGYTTAPSNAQGPRYASPPGTNPYQYPASPTAAHTDEYADSSYPGMNTATGGNNNGAAPAEYGYWTPPAQYGYANYGRADLGGPGATLHESNDEDSPLSDAPSPPEFKTEP